MRVGRVDVALLRIDPKAKLILVMNHCSDVDYVSVKWLV